MEQKQGSKTTQFGCQHNLVSEHVEIRKALGEISSEINDNMFIL